MMRDTFTGTLKQLDVTRIGPHGRRTIGLCFPEFERQRDAGRELGVPMIVSAHGMNLVQSGRRRRFAGGPDLPIARYHSVCSDADGNDGGSLCFELMTYWSIHMCGQIYPALFDTSSHPHKEEVVARVRELAGSAEDEQYRNEVLPILAGEAPMLIIHPMRPKESIEATGSQAELLDFPAVCELRTEIVVIPDCLDLRRPNHRRYFWHDLTTFPKINAHRASHAKRHDTTIDFIAALPHLIYPELGGDMFHDQVGQRLRELGYNGLIYPSARNDSCVVNIGDDVVADAGWTFVDYRGAALPITDADANQRIGRWPDLTLDDLGYAAYCWDEWHGKPATGYKTEGIAQEEWRRIENELRMMAHNQTPGLFYDRFAGRPGD
jgi:hypothetical protein